MTELTKTLELKLVDPNAHKQRKLRETRDAYQQALADAFNAGCTTQTEANDVVVKRLQAREEVKTTNCEPTVRHTWRGQ